MEKPPQESGEQQAPSSSLLSRPQVNSDGGGCGGGDGNRKSSGSVVELRSFDQCREDDDSLLVSATETVNSVDADVAVKDVSDSVADGVETLMMMKNSENFISNSGNINKPPAVVEEPYTEKPVVVEAYTGKRKRGRPPRNQAVAVRPVAPQSRKIKEDEDVCFICFDGGTLVLCDHRNCPKAYHPACIKRDEAFFQSTAKWDCGWHLCNNCQRAAYYMCYTCTYSLCKGCTKGADFSTVRGSKGFCGTCMKTIMLIENGAQANGEVVQVDFDDKTSWEYLFKVYWVCLKEQLSLTVHDLTRAKNPFKEAAVLASRIEFRVDLRYGNDGKGCSSDIFRAKMETALTNIKANDPLKVLNKAHCPSIETSGNDSVISFPEGTKWATNELLEFVAHMKNGDTSMLSHFDLQGLLLEYIKRNNLEDPLQKCEIICDSRLTSLFGKARVGHIEMLKLLEYHVFTNSASPPVETIKGGVVDAVASQAEANGSINNQPMMENDRKRKTRKRTDEKTPPANSEYAAINFHNINLIYLTRKLMENMIDDDINKFREKAIGSIVRIKIYGGDQKHEAYRLVQVVGTSKASEPYNFGSKTTDVVLEILNLDKKELVSIDDLSNQEFSEDECIRLRQSIKCGLNKRLKVGEIKDKAMTLKAMKVWPEGCQPKLLEIPEVHADPKMDQAYDSDDDAGFVYDKKKEVNKRRRASGVGRKKVIPKSLNKAESRAHQNQSSTWERDENVCTTFYVHKDGIVHTPGSIVSSSRAAVGASNWNSPKSEIISAVMTETSPAMSEQSISDTDADKIWNYRDPMGKTQGPFPMAQMRKWSVHFPADLKVWRINESQDDSILLSLALQRKYSRDLTPVNLQPQEVRTVTDEKDKSLNVESCRSDNVEIEQAGGGSSTQNNEFARSEGSGSHSSGVTATDVSMCGNGDNGIVGNVEHEIVRNAGLGSHSSTVTTPTQNDVHVHSIDDVVNEIIRSVGLGSHSSAVTNPTQSDASIHGTDNSKLARGDGLDSHSSRVTALSLNDTTHGNVNDRLGRSDRLSSHSSGCAPPANGQTRNIPVGWDSLPKVDGSIPSSTFPVKSSETPKFQVDQGEVIRDFAKTTDGGYNNQKRPDCNVPADQSPGQNEIGQSIDASIAGWDCNSMAPPVSKSLEILAKNGSIDFLNLGGSTPKSGNGELRVQTANVKISMSSDIPLQDPVPSWNTASSLVPGGTQLRELAGEWNGYSAAPAKHVEEWDLNISQKPVGMVDQLTRSSPSYPVPDAPSWQAMVNDPADFASLVDESVSDLLAEVEAMESLNGISSATSGMRLADDEDDCFSPLDGFSPAHGPGKSDKNSSTGDFHAPSHLTVTDESFRISQADFLFSQKHSSVCSHSSASSSGVSINRQEMGSHVQPMVPSSSDVDTVTADLLWRLEPQNREAHWASIHSNGNSRAGGGLSLASAVPDMNWRNHQATALMNPSLSMSTATVSTATVSTPYENPRILNNQPRYYGVDNRFSGQRDGDFGDNRFSEQRDHGFYGRDSDFSRGNRSSFNHWQQSMNGSSTNVGGGQYRTDRQQPAAYSGIHTNGGGNYYRQQPPKGQRVCKFYENGHCKRGASCSYWHPQP